MKKITQIIPAILPQTLRAIDMGVEQVHDIVSTVQIDFVDGNFAHNRTWVFNNKDEEQLDAILKEEAGMPFWDSINYEFDLMIQKPLESMGIFIALGPARIIFHLESLDTEEMIAYFETLPEIIRTTIAFGIALNIDTDPTLIAPYIPFIDRIQCMGITEVGFQGHGFDAAALEQIKKIRALYPDISISVDGGVKVENASAIIAAGADTLIVGSTLFQTADLHGTMEALLQACGETNTQ